MPLMLIIKYKKILFYKKQYWYLALPKLLVSLLLSNRSGRCSTFFAPNVIICSEKSIMYQQNKMHPPLTRIGAVITILGTENRERGTPLHTLDFQFLQVKGSLHFFLEISAEPNATSCLFQKKNVAYSVPFPVPQQAVPPLLAIASSIFNKQFFELFIKYVCQLLCS